MNSKHNLRLPGSLLSTGLINISLLGLLISLTACIPMQHVKTFDKEQRALALIDQGTQDLREKQLEKAQGAFSAALEISPKAAAFDGLGCVAFALGDFERAKDLFIRANKLDPKYYNSIANLALLYEQLGRLEIASSLYQVVIRQEPQNFRARNNFAAYLFQTNHREQAKSELFKALALAKHPTIQGNLEEIKNHE